MWKGFCLLQYSIALKTLSLETSQKVSYIQTCILVEFKSMLLNKLFGLTNFSHYQYNMKIDYGTVALKKTDYLITTR